MSQESSEQIFFKVDYITFDIVIEVPAMYLARSHKIHLEWFYFICVEVDGVCPAAGSKQYHMKKGMPVGTMQMRIMLPEISVETLY